MRIPAKIISEVNSTSTEYPLMEDFYSIQGEGYHTGKAAYFIRLAGCDVGCVWCDVKDSWQADKHPTVTLYDILARVKASGANRVIVTGGEPAMYDLKPLTEGLQRMNVLCHIETSGAYPLTGSWDWICVSPKKFKAPLPEVLRMANELKVIVYNQSDFDWADEHAKQVSTDCMLYLQPEYSVMNKVMSSIIDYVKHNVPWKISLQTHKFMGIP